ncbi:MAG: 50S ribosomal protein L11 methyltransferase [Myxococcota bacterium]
MTSEEEEVRWNRVFLDVAMERIDEAAALLWAVGASGVEIRDVDTFPDSAHPLAPNRARAVAFFGGEDLESTHARVGDELHRWSLTEGQLRVEPFTDETWKERWKQFFKPARISERLAVGPPWEPPEALPGVTPIVIEPGLAFGTGTHATTRLCLSWIDGLLADSDGQPRSILDVGCGSGILSIAAAKLTGPDVVIEGLDIDPEAHRVSRENLEHNHIPAGRVLIRPEPLDRVTGTYGLVMANILSHILVLLAPDLVRCTAPGGQLLLSGIGLDGEPEVREAFIARGMRPVERREREGWVALLMVHGEAVS